jgi:hypothetical protein
MGFLSTLPIIRAAINQPMRRANQRIHRYLQPCRVGRKTWRQRWQIANPWLLLRRRILRRCQLGALFMCSPGLTRTLAMVDETEGAFVENVC